MTINNAIGLAKNLIALAGANADITSMTGLTGELRAPTVINDINGNEVLSFTSVANAVNYIDITNAATGNPPIITAKGDDTNVSIRFKVQNAGQFLFNTPIGNNVIAMIPNSDTNTFQMGFRVFPLTANRTFTFPDLSGTIAVTSAGSVNARAGGGQALATQMTVTATNISVCATAGDSVKLNTNATLQPLYIRNSGAASCNLFPQSGGQINALGVDAALAIASGAAVIIIPFTSTQAYSFSVA